MILAEAIESIGKILDGLGVAVIVIGFLVATAGCGLSSRRQPGSSVYSTYRRRLGRGILLGLEFLVAADIIRAMVVGIVLLAQLDVSTSTLQSSLFMLVLGIGIGCVMQVIMLLAQNSVEQRDMGVASSTSTFTRSIGGAFGVAIFGAIFSAQLHSGLENVGASGVASGTGQIDPATLDALPPSVLSGVLDAIAGPPVHSSAG